MSAPASPSPAGGQLPLAWEDEFNRLSEYLRFVVTLPEGKKTVVVEVISARLDVRLGTLRWYGAWRQYSFFPEQLTIWNSDCLAAISVALKCLNTEHRRARSAT